MTNVTKRLMTVAGAVLVALLAPTSAVIGADQLVPYFNDSPNPQPWGWPEARPAIDLPDFNETPSALRGQNPIDWQRATVIVLTPDGFGSGAFVSPDGWIVTNYHVVAEATQLAAVSGEVPPKVGIITCEESGGYVQRRPETLAATVYRVDPAKDLALLKLDDPPSQTTPMFFLLSEEAIGIGQECQAVGSQAGGAPWMVRPGVIVGRYRFPFGMTEPAAGEFSGALLERTDLDILVSTCPISPGDSGGPLLNKDGRLIGLTFATPANLSAGSMGYHISATEIAAFMNPMPERPELCPLDTWTAGLPAAYKGEPVLIINPEMTMLKNFFWADEETMVAELVFFDMQNRECAAFTAEDSLRCVIPKGLWGMGDGGRFAFDVFLLRRIDGLLALGYVNKEGVVDHILLDRDGDSMCDMMWRAAEDAEWSALNPLNQNHIVDETRVAPEVAASILSIVQSLPGRK